MSDPQRLILAFDLYGTLLSTSSIASKLGQLFGKDKATRLAQTWRKYQLEYTWRANCMGLYVPFSALTRRSLYHTLGENGLSSPSDSDVVALMEAYDNLDTFPDVHPALEELKEQKGIEAVIFSNGTEAMVRNSVERSPSLAQYAHLFKNIVTVEEVRKFKPDTAVYHHLARTVGKEKQLGDIWLVSGNPFDVVGAKCTGMKVCWVDRGNEGWTDMLVEDELGRPDITVKTLSEVVSKLRQVQG